MTQTSKNALAVLLVITMMISLAGTITAVIILANYDGYTTAPVQSHDMKETAGKVSLYLPSKPVEITGRVAVSLLTSEEGG